MTERNMLPLPAFQFCLWLSFGRGFFQPLPRLACINQPKRNTPEMVFWDRRELHGWVCSRAGRICSWILAWKSTEALCLKIDKAGAAVWSDHPKSRPLWSRSYGVKWNPDSGLIWELRDSSPSLLWSLKDTHIHCLDFKMYIHRSHVGACCHSYLPTRKGSPLLLK